MHPAKPLPADRPLWKQLLFRRLRVLAVLVGLIVVGGGGCYFFAPQWLMQLHTYYEASTAHVKAYRVQAGDTDWSYYEGGNGPVIVLLHGYAGSKNDWLSVAAILSKHFHVVIPDLPGWGASSRQAGANYDIETQAKRLQAFVDALHLQRFILAGHSMGGAIAGVYAAEHPSRVAGLALVDSFGLSFKENAFARDARAGHNPFLFNDRAGFERMLRLVFQHPPKMPGRFIDVLVHRNRANHAFLKKVFDELKQPDQSRILDSRLPQLTMPVVGIWCSADKVIDKSALNTLRSGLTHAASIGATVINGCDHVPEREKPRETAQVLEGFALGH